MLNMAIIPYSSGDNNRAIIRPIMKLTPAVEKRSIPLQSTPLTVFFFNEADDILYCLIPCKLLFFLGFVHFFVIALVVAAGYVVHPCLVVEVPADGALDAFFEL